MKSLFIGVFIILFSLKSNNCNYHNTETLFLGYEKMEGYIDERKPEYQWFRKTLIKFKNDSVFIDQSPISINKNDTLKSESDGGFYYYKGIKNENANQIKISTKEISCDFCPTEVKRNSNGENVKVKREKNLVAKRVGNNLQIGNDVYKKVKIGKLKLRSEFLK
jgi:hypothetical protein